MSILIVGGKDGREAPVAVYGRDRARSRSWAWTRLFLVGGLSALTLASALPSSGTAAAPPVDEGASLATALPGAVAGSVSAGDNHSCGLKTDGTLACWGLNGFGQASPPAGTFTAVSAGTFHSCGLKTDGTLACWGSISSGQASPPAGTFTAVSAGGAHGCALRTDGTLACWGFNGSGQASPPPALSPPRAPRSSEPRLLAAWDR